MQHSETILNAHYPIFDFESICDSCPDAWCGRIPRKWSLLLKRCKDRCSIHGCWNAVMIASIANIKGCWQIYPCHNIYLALSPFRFPFLGNDRDDISKEILSVGRCCYADSSSSFVVTARVHHHALVVAYVVSLYSWRHRPGLVRFEFGLLDQTTSGRQQHTVDLHWRGQYLYLVYRTCIVLRYLGKGSNRTARLGRIVVIGTLCNIEFQILYNIQYFQ
jgi:hypothetical protein